MVGESRPSGLDDDEEWDNVIEASRADSDDEDYGLSLSLGELPAGKCSFLIPSKRHDDPRVFIIQLFLDHKLRAEVEVEE